MVYLGLPINSMVIFHGKLLVITRWYSNEQNVNLESTPPTTERPRQGWTDRSSGTWEKSIESHIRHQREHAISTTDLPLTYHSFLQKQNLTLIFVMVKKSSNAGSEQSEQSEPSYSNRALDKVSSHSCARGCPLASATRLFSYSTAIDSYRSCRSYRNVFPKYPLAMTNIAIENDHL